MARTFFQFKQFTVHHDRCAMKVGTDGVLLGAWARLQGAREVLDIGTGTGLIALMAAQRNATARVVGVELDVEASRQAAENVAASPWKGRIRIVNCDIKCFEKGGAEEGGAGEKGCLEEEGHEDGGSRENGGYGERCAENGCAEEKGSLENGNLGEKGSLGEERSNEEESPEKERHDEKGGSGEKGSLEEGCSDEEGRFDVILSNPPYFSNALGCPTQGRQMARHDSSLSFADLMKQVARLLKREGEFSVVIPADAAPELIGIAAQNRLFLVRKTWIQTTPKASPKRTLLAFRFTAPQGRLEEDTLVIETAPQAYTEAYKALTRDFYLKM